MPAPPAQPAEPVLTPQQAKAIKALAAQHPAPPLPAADFNWEGQDFKKAAARDPKPEHIGGSWWLLHDPGVAGPWMDYLSDKSEENIQACLETYIQRPNPLPESISAGVKAAILTALSDYFGMDDPFFVRVAASRLLTEDPTSGSS